MEQTNTHKWELLDSRPDKITDRCTKCGCLRKPGTETGRYTTADGKVLDRSPQCSGGTFKRNDLYR